MADQKEPTAMPLVAGGDRDGSSSKDLQAVALTDPDVPCPDPLTDCGICQCPITPEDRKQIAIKKLASGFCLQDSYAVRSFQLCCKQQKTEQEMERLRATDYELWRSTVVAFRDQRSVGKGTKFDMMKHIESTKKSMTQEQDDVYRPLLFSAYKEHYQNLPAPLTLTEAQATAKWYQDLADPTIKKSDKRYYNPRSKQDEVLTRVHVQVDELEHRKEAVERSQVVQKETSSKNPSPAQTREFMDKLNTQPVDAKAFKAGQVDLPLEFEDEDGPPSALGKGRNTRRNTKGADASAPATSRRASCKAAPRIENIDLVASSKANVLMVSVEAVHKQLSQQVETALGTFKEEFAHVLAKTEELIRDGITEANIASWVVKGEDPYNLGTNRSVYRCALQFLDRVNMAKVLLGEKALQGFETGEEWALKGGFLPQEFATVAVPCNLLLMDLKGFLLEGEHTRNGIEDQSKKVRLILSGYRSMGNALRKGTTDMQSALNTIKTAAALRAKQAESASDRKAAKAKVKATKLPNFAATSDPSIIKIHRSITKHMDIEKASSFETLKNCRGGDKPFILRRGKNIYKTNFKGKWPKAKDKIQANLLPPGANLDDKQELVTTRTDILGLIPGTSDWPFVSEEVVDASASGFSDADGTACTAYYESLFLAGQRKDFIHHGVELNGLAGVRLQLEGNRILAMALVDDIRKYLCEKSGDDDPEEVSFDRCSSFFLRLDLDNLNAADRIPSLRAAVIKPGDITYTPPGMLIVDKTVNEDSICLRVPVAVMPLECIPSMRIFCHSIDKPLHRRLNPILDGMEEILKMDLERQVKEEQAEGKTTDTTGLALVAKADDVESDGQSQSSDGDHNNEDDFWLGDPDEELPASESTERLLDLLDNQANVASQAQPASTAPAPDAATTAKATKERKDTDQQTAAPPAGPHEQPAEKPSIDEAAPANTMAAEEHTAPAAPPAPVIEEQKQATTEASAAPREQPVPNNTALPDEAAPAAASVTAIPEVEASTPPHEPVTEEQKQATAEAPAATQEGPIPEDTPVPDEAAAAVAEEQKQATAHADPAAPKAEPTEEIAAAPAATTPTQAAAEVAATALQETMTEEQKQATAEDPAASQQQPVPKETALPDEAAAAATLLSENQAQTTPEVQATPPQEQPVPKETTLPDEAAPAATLLSENRAQTAPEVQAPAPAQEQPVPKETALQDDAVAPAQAADTAEEKPDHPETRAAITSEEEIPEPPSKVARQDTQPVSPSSKKELAASAAETSKERPAATAAKQKSPKEHFFSQYEVPKTGFYTPPGMDKDEYDKKKKELAKNNREVEMDDPETKPAEPNRRGTQKAPETKKKKEKKDKDEKEEKASGSKKRSSNRMDDNSPKKSKKTKAK